MENGKRLIDANELEAKMGGLCDEFGTDHLFIDAIVYEIGNAPTVDATEYVHGEWIDAKFVRAHKSTNMPVVQCSICKCYFCDVINNHHYMYHYCPNCGAKMYK